MNIYVENGGIYDKLQAAAMTVVPGLMAALPITHAGLVTADLVKRHNADRARTAVQAPVNPGDNEGDNIIYDVNGNVIRRYNNTPQDQKLADISKFEDLNDKVTRSMSVHNVFWGKRSELPVDFM